MVNSPLASISHRVLELPHRLTLAKPVMTMTFSRFITPCNLDRSTSDSEDSRAGKSKQKLAQGVTLTVCNSCSASVPFVTWKSAKLSHAIALQSSLFLFKLSQMHVVLLAKLGRWSIPLLRLAQIGLTCVILNRGGCMRPRMLNSMRRCRLHSFLACEQPYSKHP